MHSSRRLKEILKDGKMKRFKRFAAASAIVVVSLMLYIVGVKFLLLPALIIINAWILPMPRIFASWLGRLVASFLLVMACLQIAASLQFIIFPKSGFITLTVFLVLLQMAVWLVAPQKKNVKIPAISTSDWCGLLVVIGFLLPFAPILTGHSAVERIATISTYQAIDGVTHYTVIAEQVEAGHLNYAPGHYYPYGFHMAVGYMQNTLFKAQYDLGWQNNTFLYLAQYLLFGSLLGYVSYFLCLSWLRSLKEKLVPEGLAWVKPLTALCLAPIMSIMCLLPFVHEGFLNYYYVCLTLVCGAIFLTELRYSRTSGEDSLNVAHDAQGGWHLTAFLLLLFGASASWPLMLPPFLVTGLLFLLPSHPNFKALIAKLWTPKLLPIAAAFTLQLLPLYFQLRYGTASGRSGLNASGSITPFHPLILLTGVGLVGWLVARTKLDEAYRRTLLNIFGPLLVFLGMLMAYQYFSVGELRYYSVKVSILVEIFIMVLGVAVLVAAFVASKLYEAKYAWILPMLPLLLVLLMISLAPNPFKYDRDLLMPRVPQHLKADIQAVAKLGSEGKLDHGAMIVLHYNPAKDTFFADMKLPYWAGVMRYQAGWSPQGQKHACKGGVHHSLAFDSFATPTPQKSVSEAGVKECVASAQDLACIGKVYHDATFVKFASPNLRQRALKENIKTCIKGAQKRHEPFYVVTDTPSLPEIKKALGSSPVYVSYPHF